MPEELRDSEELGEVVKEYSSEIESWGKEQLEHQEDLESLEGSLASFTSMIGLYEKSDEKLTSHLKDAIKTRETDVETCKEKIGEIKTEMETKLENLSEKIQKTNERMTKMEQVLGSLHHKNEGIIDNIRSDIQQQKDDIDDANQKCNHIEEIIKIGGSLMNSIGNSAEGIAHLLDALKNYFAP